MTAPERRKGVVMRNNCSKNDAEKISGVPLTPRQLRKYERGIGIVWKCQRGLLSKGEVIQIRQRTKRDPVTQLADIGVIVPNVPNWHI
jgi:hypothetical protein